MLSYILFICIVGLLLMLLLPAIILSFFSKLLYILGFRRKPHGGQRKEQGWQNAGDKAQSANAGKKNEHRKKVFDDDEGEYVDFEEIK